MNTQSCKKEFIKIIKCIANRFDTYRVFNDFVEMASISIRNVFLKSNDLEKRYLDIAGQYNKKEIHDFPKLLGVTTEALENLDCDFLGEVYAEIGLANSDKGQFFTPYSLSKMIAVFNIPGMKKLITKNSFVTISDPACGSGGLIVALANVMRDEGLNYQKDIYVNLIDVHTTAAYMAYIQLSLLYIPAIITVGNSLTLEVKENLYTPAHYMGFWDSKLILHYEKNKKRKRTELILPENEIIPKRKLTSRKRKRVTLL